MSPRDRLALALFITRRKLLTSKVSVLVVMGFILLLASIWVKDSFWLSFRAFFYLFPFLFLFFSQDMMHDEISSGALENVFFAEGRFRSYLLSKNILVAGWGIGLSLAFFSVFVLYGIATHQWEAEILVRFAAGLLAGVYYVALAGLLSFFFRAGSNVLIVLLGQCALFAALLFTVSQRTGLAARLTDSACPGIGAKLEFLAVSLVFPNMVIARRSWLNLVGLGVVTALLFGLHILKIKSLELRKR
jgi:hypothetical protein